MEIAAHISYRPVYPDRRVIWMRVMRYIQTGYLLHLMAVSSVFLFYFFGKEFLMLVKNGGSWWKVVLSGYASAYFFSLIFFSQLDARSRYQNYKMVKDKFFQYGFDSRLLKPFVYSRCQRDAIGVAARELQFHREWKLLICKFGFRWYHLLPQIIVQCPRVLFTKTYWNKTLFVKTYRSKYFLW
jgi:hypothetical protein